MLSEAIKKRFIWLKQLLKDAINSGTFQSKLIEEYYLEISIPYMKKILKASIVILIVYVYTSMFFMSVFRINKIYAMISQSITLMILLICLGSTIFLRTYRSHIRTSMFSVLTVLLQNMLSHYDVNSKMEVTYTPIMQLVILVFSFIPMNFTTAVSISVLTICFLLIGTTLRISLLKDFDVLVSARNDTILTILSDNLVLIGNFNITAFVSGQIFLWISAYINAGYMYTCNRLWRRSAFLNLRENVEAKKQSKKAMSGQLRWIEAIMPHVVKNEYLKHQLDFKSEKWVYIKPFDNVSILFADIVGFTNMSSNKSAPQVVTLLNDLFNQFDELCAITNCEKLGTLGDCYYCMAGCPLPRSDHAVSCIEMGLGMCRIIKRFNEEHNEDVNMRVGIHTGRVNAAIIGTQRFRFDVYSNDVIIANAMESSGEPGRVHISQQVLNIIRNTYIVVPGADLEIKREEGHGIAGMALKTTLIKTYFVDPKSSHLQKSDERFGKKDDFHVLGIKLQTYGSSNDDDDDDEDDIDREINNRISKMSYCKKSYTNQVNQEIAFIETLRCDPDQQIQCFHDPPINNITLTFYNPEIEWHYQAHTIDHIQNLSLYSAKFAPLVECIISMLCTLLIFIAAICFFYDDLSQLNNVKYVIALFGLTVSLIVIEYWKASTYYSLLNNPFDRCVYLLLSHQIYKSFICFYMTVLPNLMCFLLLNNCKQYSNDYYYQARYFSLALFSMLIGSLFVSTCLIVKVVALILNFVQCIVFGCLVTCNDSEQQIPARPFYTCIGCMKFDGQFFSQRLLTEYLFQFFYTFFIVVVLIREREKNLRTWFYVTREAEIVRDEALRAMISSQELLYNIIPRYVFNNIKARGDNLDSGNFSYALTIPKAAVVFACISNFFSKYYREDYKGGENALKLLHMIISMFDNILHNTDYKDVEKIKTINDCYMLASGLNPSSTDDNDSKTAHLIALMRYAFEMQKVLENFNEHYIIGSDKFEIKIGYNVGPVTAGIIGSTKPMYDIWGDTVNVSSRMYSTGKPGDIQVPHYVADELKSFFEFKYRDKIFVKGKGDMNTYLCLKEIL